MVTKQTKINSVVQKVQRLKERVSTTSKTYYQKSSVFIKRRPVISFFVALGLLLLVLIAGRVLQQKPAEEASSAPTKTVAVYGISDKPKATFQAKVEKSGLVTIVAQTAGIVQNVSVTEGQRVAGGQSLVSLSSTYQGGSAPSVQRQIAQTQYQNVLNTFDLQKNLLNNQRSVATASAENSKQLRDLTKTSANESDHLIHANQEQLDTLKAQLDERIASGADPDAIFALEGQINQLQGGINQLVAQARTSGYQSGDDKAPALLEALAKTITFQQLDVQESSLNLNKEVSRLQADLAAIGEQAMYPASPFAGTVERVNVRVGQSVSPGTVIATVTADSIVTTAVLSVPENISKIILTGEPSELLIDGKIIAVKPYHVSTQATDGQLYSVIYEIPEEYQGAFTANEYISISVPIAPAEEVAALDPFIPIDAVYQSQEKAFVLVVQKDKAVTKEVQLGNVYGSYVEAIKGLTAGDQVIVDRNVIAGEKVKIQ